MKYKSRVIPVVATQWFKDGDHKDVSPIWDGFNILGYELDSNLGSTMVDSGDWIVEFPNGEIHVVQDVHFKQRFEQVESFTKAEQSYARKLAETSDCE